MDLFKILHDDEIIDYLKYQRYLYIIRERVDHINLFDD